MVTRQEIRQTLIEMVESEMGEAYPDVQESSTLREEMGLDSIDVVSIVSQVERKFRIRLTHQELETLVTVGDVLDLLERKVNDPPSSAAA
jgi:acyl carrier protein